MRAESSRGTFRRTGLTSPELRRRPIAVAMFLGADATLLARIQFALTVTYHIIFPAFTIGLSSYIALLEGVWFSGGDNRFDRLARYWIRIFAVSFAMGVVSGAIFKTLAGLMSRNCP